MWPLLGHFRISQEFRTTDEGRPHDGIDLPAPVGTKIVAPEDGRVVYSGSKFNGYGKLIILEHRHGLSTLYGHLSKIYVKPGQFIQKGKTIGRVGKTGRASAPHLHFEVRKNRIPVDPLRYLK